MAPDGPESWRDHEVGRPGLNLSGLQDGDSLTATVVGEPYFSETQISETETGNAFHVPVMASEWPDGYTNMSDEEISDDEEYDIINSSSSFFRSFKEAFPEGGVMGEEFTVTVDQEDPDNDMTRSYTVESE